MAFDKTWPIVQYCCWGNASYSKVPPQVQVVISLQYHPGDAASLDFESRFQDA